jgi:hypothetical protein
MGFKTDKQICLDCLESSFGKLGVVANDSDNQMIADLIIDSMTGQWRVFHNPDHIFQVSLGGDAIEVISSLFHDTVYVQVDQGIPTGVARFIDPFIRDADQTLLITSDPDLAKDDAFNLCLMIFGLELGQALTPAVGQNEFLSALFASKVLEKFLPLPLLAQIIACIEATIPFRKSDDQGTSASTRLYFKLTKVNDAFMFGWQDRDIQEIIKRGVRLANRDIADFTSEISAQFLDGTCKLILEANPELRRADTCGIGNYRVALQKMANFLRSLQAERVITQYQNEPDNEEYARLIFLVKRNLEIADTYFDINLLSIAVLEALSRKPMMENLKKVVATDLHKEQFTEGAFEQSLLADTNKEVLNLFEQIYTLHLACERINSTLATYIMKSMTMKDAQSLLSQARLFFSGELSPEGFLNQCPSHLIHAGIDAARQSPD